MTRPTEPKASEHYADQRPRGAEEPKADTTIADAFPMKGYRSHGTLLLLAVAGNAQEYHIPYGTIEKIEAALPHTYIKEGEGQGETNFSACDLG